MTLHRWIPGVVWALALAGALGSAREADASALRAHHVAAARLSTQRVVHIAHRHHHAVAPHERHAFAQAPASRAASRPAPAPARETPRPRHGATPHLTRLDRHVPARRAAGQVACATAETDLRAPRVAGAASVPLYIESWPVRFGPLEGRGPPRAGPLSRTFRSERAPSFLFARRSRLTEPVRFDPAHSEPSRSTRVTSGVEPLRFAVVQPERHFGRSHVRRLEGATACFCMPSIGGFTS